MYVVGVCWKRGGWIFSVYRRLDDVYPTLKAWKVEGFRLEALKADFKVPMGGFVGNVGRFRKA